MDDSLDTNITNDAVVEPMKTPYKMIVLRGNVVFPGQSLHFDLGRDKSMAALNKALELNQDVFLVAQRHETTANPAPKDIYRIGTVARIKQVLKMPTEATRVLVQGIKKMEIESYVSILPNFEVTLKEPPQASSDPLQIEAVGRSIQEQLEEYAKLESRFGEKIEYSSDTEKFISEAAARFYHSVEDKQQLLQCKSDYAALENIYLKLIQECEIKTLERKISTRVRKNIEKNQREYYLREQIKVMHDELGDSEEEREEYRRRAAEKQLPDYVMARVEKEIGRLDKMSPTSPEAGVSRTYIETVLDLPWHEATTDNTDLTLAAKTLDEDHYGLEKVKERIIEYLAVHTLTDNLKGPILCFVGPPGVGKTSIVSSIARAVGRKFVSMSLGGVRDEAEIRGHRRTYIGALPGRIISGIRTAGVVNPVFLLDEIDKMSSDFRGDPASAMLEVLDPNQNNIFKDHYLDLPYDLSQTMFVTTANSVDTIPAPLLDRMEVIELSGYTYEEKLHIAQKFLLPKQLSFNGLDGIAVHIADDVMMRVISLYTRESGVRNLERNIATIARKLAVKTVKAQEKPAEYTVTAEDLNEYLGVPKYRDNEVEATDEAGVVNGLAWTSVGGVTMEIEATLIADGKGEITLTGNLGDVMKESCRTALSLIRSRADKYGIPVEKFTKYDLHVHVPEGATPKDGPSAGITMATAILSAMTGRKVRANVAMTGEITLRGKVLPIGGLKEKTLAAFRAGVKTVIIPQDNVKDVAELPEEVTANVTIRPAADIDTVFNLALV